MSKPPKSKLPGVLHQPAYLAIRAGVGLATLPPAAGMLEAGERAGMAFGSAWFNRRRVERAYANLRVAFPQWDEDRIRAVAKRSYGHLFRLGLEVAYAPRLLTDDAWFRHVGIGEIAPAVDTLLSGRPVMLITGHVGNWEVLGYTVALLGFPMHALYRPLDLPPLDRWVRRTRARRGLELVDKFGALRQLPELVAAGAPVGFVADQNAGDRGLFVPYFNRLVSTYKSIGLLALRFNASVVCGFARRVPPVGVMGQGGGKGFSMGFQMEVTDRFGPEDWSSHPDPLFYLTARYRRGIELMVRRAPEQYLWMHRIWRSRPRHERSNRPFPPAFEEKLRLLPWVRDEDLAAIKDHSARDARTLAQTGQDKLS